MLQDMGYREPFDGYYLRLTCTQQLVHESKVTAMALSVDKETDNSQLMYICPNCKMQHVSVLEGY